MPRPSGATRELSQRYRARHSEKSVQQNGDADSDMGMVFAARTGPPGSTVHFLEYSAGQDDCIRTGHSLLAPRMSSTGNLDRQTDLVETNRHVCVAPDPKITSISAMLLNCSGTGGTCVAEYSVFCTAQAGVHKGQKEHPGLFMQSAMENMQNTKRRHC